ncbi:MAG: uroporphyrinogen-III synthase [Sphingobacteriaceae bacterium]|nr:uroporphyrinogen-III synthase [Sphingobacteriaceae bacterium]
MAKSAVKKRVPTRPAAKSKKSPKKGLLKAKKKSPLAKKKNAIKKPLKSVSKVSGKKTNLKTGKVVPKEKIKTVLKQKKSENLSLPLANGTSEIPIKKVRKSSKKLVINIPPPPKIEVSNYPKNKIKNILISQPQPTDPEKNPYILLGKKHNLNLTFKQFIKVEGLSSQDFRAQRIDILEHGAVILTSKLSVDHYFKMCNEMRVTVPESMKYFCINEQTAYYLQKYIQYRKRKIFFGHGTMMDLVDVIRKNKDEKFLLPVSDVHKEQIVDFLDELKINYTKGVFYKTVSANLSDIKSLNEFDAIVFFTPAGVKSLKSNFPSFKQGGVRMAVFGHSAALSLKDLGYRVDIFAPNPLNPSMVGALDAYIKEANKR